MNQYYSDFIARSRSAANREGLTWDLPYDERGLIPKEHRWNISRVCNLTQGSTAWVRTLSFFEPAIAPLNTFRRTVGLAPIDHGPMSPEWIEFFLAVMLFCVFESDMKPQSALCNIGQFIRLLAAVCHGRRPSEITPDDVRLAYNVALAIGNSGKQALNLRTTIRTIFDENHLSDFGPLASYCTPFNDYVSAERHKNVERRRRIQNAHRKSRSRKSLAEKQDAEKLPDMDAFWELIRILFTCKPRTFSDAVRFCIYTTLIYTGFRVGEALRLPDQCLRSREYVDRKGRSSALKGGIATSLVLRHFAEKQTLDRNQNGFVLVEAFQDVPELFADPLRELVGRARQLTRPLRERLAAQVATGRMFPDLEPDAIVPDWELYLRLSGNIQLGEAKLPKTLVERYRETFSEEALDELRNHQIVAYQRSPNRRIFEYFEKWTKKAEYLTFRDINGNPVPAVRGWHYYFKVSDIERYIDEHLPTKKTNLGALALSSGGKLEPQEFLFLFPTRSVIEDRDGGVIDVGRYAFVGIGSEADLEIHLGLKKPNIFTRYGGPEAADFKIITHAFRHLQNDELFRAGVSDAVITMRFGRRSPAQSHVYNHKSLAEDLDYMDVPGDGLDPLSPNVQRVFHLVKEGKVEGPIVREFRRIQREMGDDDAFAYLNAEAGGLHVTPYGFCLSSLTVDPCPKHLECFNGCHHLARTGLASETEALTDLHDRLVKVIDRLEAEPTTARSVQTQIDHARTRLDGVRRALATVPRAKVSPEGPNRFQRFVVTTSKRKQQNG